MSNRLKVLKKNENRRGITYASLEHDLQDIAGLRVMVQLLMTLKEVVEILRKRQDMRIVQERDYITHRRLRAIVLITWLSSTRLIRSTGEDDFGLKFQIRTLAMDFRATIEHSAQL